MSDLEDWVIVPDDNENEVKLMNSILDKSVTIDDTTTSLLTHPALSSLHKSDMLDSQPELENDDELVKTAESPTRRYSSPLFQNLLKAPVEPVKFSKPSIPEDNSIHNLLHAANLVSKTQKRSETLTPTNTPESSLSEEATDEILFNNLSVPEKRLSVQDPERVLMENVVPGENLCRLGSIELEVYLVCCFRIICWTWAHQMASCGTNRKQSLFIWSVATSFKREW